VVCIVLVAEIILVLACWAKSVLLP